MFIDDRKRETDTATPTRVYDRDREKLQQLYPNDNLTMADRVRRALSEVEAEDTRHPFTPDLLRMVTKLRETGYTEEADHLEALAGLWDRAENNAEHRDALNDAARSALVEALQTSTLSAEDEAMLDEIEQEVFAEDEG